MVAQRRSKVQGTELAGGERTSASRRTRTMKETLSLKHPPIFAQSKPSYLSKPNHFRFFLYSKKLRAEPSLSLRSWPLSKQLAAWTT
ncbi:hypothetical protein M0R45_019947 [Rubus argutus]|uniref:Uncharacterized protein n=1 Tax=Rubus argutus TaxID=59490 RepID=A0AAW1X6Y6_RUBAR